MSQLGIIARLNDNLRSSVSVSICIKAMVIKVYEHYSSMLDTRVIA